MSYFAPADRHVPGRIGKKEAKKKAREFELKARDAPSYAHRANDYETAAKYWLKAKNIENAIRDYETAAAINYKMATLDFKRSESYGHSHGKYCAERAKKLEDNATRLKRLVQHKWHGLEGKAVAVITIAGFAFGLLFLSPNVTGNVIGSAPRATSNLIGAILFGVGLVGAWFWARNR